MKSTLSVDPLSLHIGTEAAQAALPCARRLIPVSPLYGKALVRRRDIIG